tara:strand:- start:1386 stop:1823 length:438 start_codon:yes stop_codon:yes gene_type:complete
MILIFLGMALAAEPIARPEPPAPVDGECTKVYPINRGQLLPSPVLLPPGAAGCSAVVVPLSQFADLLETEAWGEAVSQQYSITTASLEMEIDWYKAKLEEESKPPPFLERPGTQRWFGRLETLVTVGVVAVGLSAAYQYGSGGYK